MPGTYRIIPSDGNVANQITVEPLQTVSTTPLTFAGYRNPVYGEILWSDLYHLLENFASPNAPTDTKAVQGQLWFKKTSATAGELYVRHSSTVGGGLNSWVKILTTADGSKCTVAATPPAAPVLGELWYDNADEGRGFIWVGNGWIDFCPGGGGSDGYTVGPTAPPSPIVGQQWFNTSTPPGVLTLFGTDFTWHAVTSGGGSGAVVPVASFTRSPISGNAPLSVTFTDTSSNSPTSWAWSFGDGATSTAQNPVHSYAAAGTYTVTHSASNSAGTSATVTQTGAVTVTTGSGINEVVTVSSPTGTIGGIGPDLIITGGNPFDNFSWSLVKPSGSTAFTSGTDVLDASGGKTWTNINSNMAGEYIYTFVFSSTNHTRVAPTITLSAAAATEVITVSPSTITVGDAGTILTITGGTPNTGYTWSLSPPAGWVGVPNGSGTLDGSGGTTSTPLVASHAGNYIYTFTFAGTGHILSAPIITAKELITVSPSTITLGGAGSTLSIVGGTPNSGYAWSLVKPAGSSAITSGSGTLDGVGGFAVSGINSNAVGDYTYTFTFGATGNTVAAPTITIV